MFSGYMQYLFCPDELNKAREEEARLREEEARVREEEELLATQRLAFQNIAYNEDVVDAGVTGFLQRIWR